MTENWDEDFEFPTLALPKGKKAETPRKRESEVASPVEDWGEDGWDDSPPPALSRMPIANLGKRKSPTQPDIGRLSLSSPRAYDSTSSDIHSPRSPTSPGGHGISASSSALQLVSGRQGPSGSSAINPRSRSGSTSATVRNKLIKRHPSTSFLPIGSTSSVDVSTVDSFPGARSSYDLSRPTPIPPLPFPRSKSGEQMPPPPLPLGHSRHQSKSNSKARSSSRQGEIRVSAIPLSPSSSQVQNVDPPRRPSFWKRLSGQPLMADPILSPGSYIQDSVRLHHKRSASLGRRNVRDLEERPPVPPIPANLRSPSATSTASEASISSSNRSGPTSISSIIRRTASGLSRKSQKGTPPPSSYPYASNQSSSASVDSIPPTPPIPAGMSSRTKPSMPASHSFSRGYHLPSPSPQSPYKPTLGSTTASPSMPNSSSFPLAMPSTSDSSDTETEPEGHEQATPRRKKIRPVSALPAPRAGISRGWNAEGWRGFSDQGPSGSKPTALVGQRSSSSETPPPASAASPRTANFAMSTANTIRRIGSMSKKHGRRLSGGLMFGGTPTLSKESSPSTFLEPVVGSPSKPGRLIESANLDGRLDAEANQTEADESFDQAREMRDGSASAPTSIFRTTSGMAASASEATIMGSNKAEKERRRQSWNDFVIPKSIMEMQSGLNKNRSAIRHFDAGIRRLEVLLDEHDQARQNTAKSEVSAAMFERLNNEFKEEWAIASVLVRVGNTGRAESGARVSSDSADQSSPRTRRITMASDEAAAAGDMLRSASDGTPPISASGVFRSSTPADPSSPMSPPRGLSDRWRASTGRHDLTPRELELLRNIMNTPVSQRPSSSARQASTISSSSSLGIRASESSKTIIASATIRHAAKSTSSDRSVSRVRLPSPSDSPFIIPSGSFPSPNTASALANPNKPKGFAGFKDFLRSMSVKPAFPSSPSARRLNFLASPTSPKFPNQSPLQPMTSPQPSIELPVQSPPAVTDRQKKRASVRNIFRSSSGDWSGLVNKDKAKEPVSTPTLARQPSQPALKRSTSKSKQSSPRRKISMRTAQFKSPTPVESPQTLLDDKTIRPSQMQGRKSRIIGLGWPELEDGLPPSGSTPPRPGPMRRSTTSDKDAIAPTGGHRKEETAYSTWSDLHEGQEQKVRTASAQSDDFTVVLTPENLPRMLEYVQDCEKTLGRWRKRAEVFLVQRKLV